MIIAVFGAFILCALVVLWLCIFDDHRTQLWRLIGQGLARVNHGGRGVGRQIGGSARRSVHLTRAGAAQGWRHFLRGRWLVLIAFLILTFPSLLVLHLNGMLDFGAIVGQDDVAVNPVVDRLLQGEHLVPPQPLPPAAFTTREVEIVRPDLVHANRNWNLLKPGFRRRLLAVYKTMQQKYGYHMVLIEGYRSPARQRRLDEGDDHVTDAGAGQSYHQYGLAADSAFLRNGKIVIRRDNAWIKRGYALYGKVAQEYGLTWGGNWSFHDYGHVELRNSKYDDPTHPHRND